jgi:beta-1,4-mannosyl-glycoprotein beta-1,4-N-acetylglucosaminyltransferase
MIYDCFIFNSELDLLELRLAYLYKTVDYFVLVESKQTLSGGEKTLFFKENEKRFERFRNKIIYVECPHQTSMKLWEYEFYQRNYIKEGLKNCTDEDIIHISDVDEIVNLSLVLSKNGLKLPALIELPYSLYFFNLVSNTYFRVNLLANYSFIKNFNIGRRLPEYPLHVKNIIRSRNTKLGWHFSFLFGYQIDKYKEKIKSFSHQEFNTPYFLNEDRIKKCIRLGVNLFESGTMMLGFKDEEKELEGILPHICELNLQSLIRVKKDKKKLTASDINYLVRKKHIPYIGYGFFKLYRKLIFTPAYEVWKVLKAKGIVKGRPVEIN